jgi:hypothetical protein
MIMRPALGLFVAFSILPAAGVAAGPAAADPAHVGHHYGHRHHYGHGHGPGWGVYHGSGPVAFGHHHYGPHRAVWTHRHGWGHHTLGYFGSSAVAPGSFACECDPAYKMDPRC